MKRNHLRHRRNYGVGNVLTGVLLGGLVGGTLRWLASRNSGVSVREKIKRSEGNVESQAHELVEKVKHQANSF